MRSLHIFIYLIYFGYYHLISSNFLFGRDDGNTVFWETKKAHLYGF